MALAIASAVGSELGLRLLLSPAASNVVLRTANVGIGAGFPVYATFKAIESKNQVDQERWLVYWTVYGCFHVAEMFSDPILSWCPFYDHAKLLFLVWLQFPNNYGALHFYRAYLRPFFLRRRVVLDRFLESTRNDINNFVRATKESREFQMVVRTTKDAACYAWETLVRGNDPNAKRPSSPGEDRTWVHVDPADDDHT